MVSKSLVARAFALLFPLCVYLLAFFMIFLLFSIGMYDSFVYQELTTTCKSNVQNAKTNIQECGSPAPDIDKKLKTLNFNSFQKTAEQSKSRNWGSAPEVDPQVYNNDFLFNGFISVSTFIR